MTRADRIFLFVGGALFGFCLSVLIAAGAALSCAREPFTRPAYAGTYLVLESLGYGPPPRTRFKRANKTHSRLGNCRPGRR